MSQKRFADYILTAVFLVIYIMSFSVVWRYIPISSSFGVLIGTLIVLIISAVLAIISSNKLIEAIKS